MKILVDAFGGDNSPDEIIKGAVEYINDGGKYGVCLVGNEDIISEKLKAYSYKEGAIEILPSTEVITCEEAPTEAIKKKPDSSIVVGLTALRKEPEYGAFVSAGSTGAILVGAVTKVGRLKGVSRPALTALLPTADGGEVMLLDVGANADCKPLNLLHFAVMGNAYLKASGIENPRVALLSNGTEDKKGNELTHEAFELIKKCGNLNFLGNMEARDILSGNYDMVVCDGFSGNVAIKSTEGAVKTLLKILKTQIQASTKAKIGYKFFMQDAFNKTRAKMDYESAGGAILLGVEKVIIKGHGSSKASSIKGCLEQAESALDNNLNEVILKDIGNIVLPENQEV